MKYSIIYFIVLILASGQSAFAKLKQNVMIADPTIIYYNGLYYMYGTESNPENGFPILTSKNLKYWNPSKVNDGYALLKGRNTFGNWGFWAPQVIGDNGKFFMLYTANEQIAIAESKSPLGPFQQKIETPLDETIKQIDPYLFIDDDGKIYLYHVRLGGGNKIFVAEFKRDFTGIKNETLTECIAAENGWEDTKRVQAPPIAEGPTVLKHKGIYYLFYSANDFRNIDYAVGYATSKSPLGPWIKYEGNPILNRKIIGYNGTGHGDVFFDKNGKMKYVFHTHHDEKNVIPRKTFIVSMQFEKDLKSKIDKVVIYPKTLVELKTILK